jgi:hypothetical protein
MPAPPPSKITRLLHTSPVTTSSISSTLPNPLRYINLQAGSSIFQYNLSRIESLPVELIQEIFLHCLELNLPKASFVLGRALSDKRIYKALLRGFLPGYRIKLNSRCIFLCINHDQDRVQGFVLLEFPGKFVEPLARFTYEYISNTQFANSHFRRVQIAKELLRCR